MSREQHTVDPLRACFTSWFGTTPFTLRVAGKRSHDRRVFLLNVSPLHHRPEEVKGRLELVHRFVGLDGCGNNRHVLAGTRHAMRERHHAHVDIVVAIHLRGNGFGMHESPPPKKTQQFPHDNMK